LELKKNLFGKDWYYFSSEYYHHLIFARADTEAGKFYNAMSTEILKTWIYAIRNRKNYDPVEAVMETAQLKLPRGYLINNTRQEDVGTNTIWNSFWKIVGSTKLETHNWVGSKVDLPLKLTTKNEEIDSYGKHFQIEMYRIMPNISTLNISISPNIRFAEDGSISTVFEDMFTPKARILSFTCGNDKCIEITLEVPGVTDLTMKVRADRVKIREKKIDTTTFGSDSQVYRDETRFGEFSREILLPHTVYADSSKVTVTHENGEYKLRLIKEPDFD